METIQDFEDLLTFLDRHRARYLIIGGLAFIYHAKPRYTKDMDLWIGPSPGNVEQANRALAEFGSPTLLAMDERTQIVQIGVAPNRIDLMVDVGGLDFESAWKRRLISRYGSSEANWIDLDSLIEIKRAIDDPKHQEDARVLMEVRRLRQKRAKPGD
jgi:hypothetical protein